VTCSFAPPGLGGILLEFLTHGLRHGLRSFARFAGYDTERVSQRLGGEVLPYRYQPGALTFKWYDIGPKVRPGQIRALLPGGQFTTTIDQVALAFTSPANLPPAGVYQEAIQAELDNMRKAID